jgi:squalene-associated FAD-dependent desaturase
MGCCTNFLDFCRRTAIDGLFDRHRTLHFFSSAGRRCDFRPSTWLPAPLHLVRPLLGLTYLSLTEKLGIARAMLRLARLNSHDSSAGPTVLAWLQEQRQSPVAIERFWKVVLVSALAESLDRASLAAARKVFLDGFLAHRQAAQILVPQVSLHELYDQRVGGWLQDRGAILHFESLVDCVLGDPTRVSGLRLANGSERAFDFVVIAVPWNRVTRLMPPAISSVIDPASELANIPSAPISSVHLWFDRPLTDLPHAVLIERLSQWVFAHRPATQTGEHYYQVVISASHDLAGRNRQEVIREVLADLAAVFPQAPAAQLLRSRLITEQHAVFSVRPGLDTIRQPQQTPIPNLLLAGDWTGTGWPATMEGAVRSGYLAAQAILTTLGRPEKIVVPDLPREWLTKWGMKDEG